MCLWNLHSKVQLFFLDLVRTLGRLSSASTGARGTHATSGEGSGARRGRCCDRHRGVLPLRHLSGGITRLEAAGAHNLSERSARSFISMVAMRHGMGVVGLLAQFWGETEHGCCPNGLPYQAILW